ncbi:Nramp family divalent metal transporter [Acidovorax sp. NCPPB 3859]|nr:MULTISPECIES: Nramp family divalent metal transporter [unclassified Acidovorax]MDA8448957.1 Nramp family divalent metal transporter [Acidovorax sp. GBBC 3297]MDA8458955.1 Nramp family divalent metal transporter [Acidovorax sp. GBBC 3333]MDA8463713.1 Nramp family divalent metal transporter [Acidovorax sp. GBBC 3332]MDA8468745.1 Nramp family divalent metal transporter [Acidovorax sp. GBBC 3299]WCM80358.1 Nramp family divalent metal transporter [Acidovorax sp. GBBC 712]
MFFPLPRTATAPFCPSEVKGSVRIDPGLPFHRKLLRYAGPGLLVSVGYMDPGNWATDIEAGSRFGYGLLFIVLLASLAAMLLQTLCVRLGLVAQKDLAQLCRERYGPAANRFLWAGAELAIIACDLAEVLGGALALHLLFGVSIPVGIGITAFDTVLVLGLQGAGFRRVEAIVLGLVGTIAACFAVELAFAQPLWSEVAIGFAPSLERLQQPGALYLAIGIVGATVMPHNLYLHSSVVQTRLVEDSDAGRREAIRFCTLDAVISLSLALLVNAAIMVLAASAFHDHGRQDVADIADAYRLIEPLVGSALAATLFGIALLASGQSSTFTGTIAGQIVMEGFLDLKIPCWQRRLITRVLALVPALVGVWWLGDEGVGKMLVLSQVVLSFQLPFAMWPLIRFTGDRTVMGPFASGRTVRVLAWGLFGVISAANVWLVGSVLAG